MNKKTITPKGVSADDMYKSAKEHIQNLDELLEQAALADSLEDEIRALRKKEKITQKDLAKKMYIAQANISRIENDILHTQLNTILKYLSALGKTIRITIEDSSVAQTEEVEKAVV